MITEDYVSFETAKLLKDKGFSEWCFKCYGVAVLHNGADISFDEECELKDQGREDEIEYVEGGMLYDYGCNNLNKDYAKVWAAPTLWVAMKWLREAHKWHIEISRGEYGYFVHIVSTKNLSTENYTVQLEGEYNLSYEEACEAGIKYCLKNLI